MANEKDRERWQSVYYEMSKSFVRGCAALAKIEAEAVKSERERCATKAGEWIVKMSYHGMNVFGADIPSIRSAILSDDQEARNG